MPIRMETRCVLLQCETSAAIRPLRFQLSEFEGGPGLLYDSCETPRREVAGRPNRTSPLPARVRSVRISVTTEPIPSYKVNSLPEQFRILCILSKPIDGSLSQLLAYIFI